MAQQNELVLLNLADQPALQWASGISVSHSRWNVTSVSDLETVQARLENEEELLALVFFPEPTIHLASLLEGQPQPAKSLMAWQHWVEKVLRLCATAPETTVLCEVGAPTDDLRALGQHLESVTSLELGSVHVEAPVQHRVPPSAPDTNPLYYVIAQNLLALSRPAELIHQLKSSSARLGELPSPLEASERAIAAFADLNTEIEHLRVTQDRHDETVLEIQKENLSVIAELHTAQERHHRFAVARAAAEAKWSQTHAKTRTLLKEKERQITSLTTTRDSLYEKAGQRARRLSELTVALTAVKQERDTLKQQLEEVSTKSAQRARRIRQLTAQLKQSRTSDAKSSLNNAASSVSESIGEDLPK